MILSSCQRRIINVVLCSGLLLSLLLTSSMVRAQNKTEVYLQPAATSAETVTVDVVTENVANLYGLELILTYDPAVLAVEDAAPDQTGIQIEAGDLLPVNQGFVIVNQADQSGGTINFAMTLLNPAPAVNGSGIVARVVFRQLQSAPATLEISSAKLVSADLQIIPVETRGLTIGQNSESIPVQSAATPVQGSDFPWWIIAAGIIIAGLAGLGLLISMKSKVLGTDAHQTSLQSSTSKPTPEMTYPQPQRRTHPSAFKNN